MTLLRAENIACQRGGLQVFANLSFRLEAGTLAHVQGENGAGKTSLLRLCAGLIPVQGGVLESSPVHFVGGGGGGGGLHAKISVRENLHFWTRLAGVKVKMADVEKALNFWGVASVSAWMPHRLSAGLAQAVALARLVLVPRPVWLLDEPFAALDKKKRARLDEAIDTHLGKGGAVLVAEHNKKWTSAVDIFLGQS